MPGELESFARGDLLSPGEPMVRRRSGTGDTGETGQPGDDCKLGGDGDSSGEPGDAGDPACADRLVSRKSRPGGRPGDGGSGASLMGAPFFSGVSGNVANFLRPASTRWGRGAGAEAGRGRRGQHHKPLLHDLGLASVSFS